MQIHRFPSPCMEDAHAEVSLYGKLIYLKFPLYRYSGVVQNLHRVAASTMVAASKTPATSKRYTTVTGRPMAPATVGNRGFSRVPGEPRLTAGDRGRCQEPLKRVSLFLVPGIGRYHVANGSSEADSRAPNGQRHWPVADELLGFFVPLWGCRQEGHPGVKILPH